MTSDEAQEQQEQQERQDEKRKFSRTLGVFERWELGLMLDEKVEYYIERAGSSTEGEPLFALYEAWICDACREKAAASHADHTDVIK